MASLIDVVSAYLINTLWQLTLIVGVALLAATMLRRAKGALLYRFWLSVTALGSGSAAIALWLPSGERSATAGLNVTSLAGGWFRGEMWIPADERLQIAIVSLAFTGVAMRLVRLWRAYRATVYLRRGGTKAVPSEVAGQAAELARRAGVTEVAVRSSGRVSGPAITGLRHPVLLLPDGFWQRHPEEVVRAALAHELMHFARRDPLLRLLEEILLMPLAWHPLTMILRRRLEHSRELACDEGAAAMVSSRQAYSRALVSVAVDVASRPEFAGVCSMGRGDLHSRVEQLVRGARPQSWMRLAATMLLIGSAAAATGSLLLMPGRSLQTQGEVMQPRIQWNKLAPPPPPPPPPPKRGQP